jgi:hypothetical protein
MLLEQREFYFYECRSTETKNKVVPMRKHLQVMLQLRGLSVGILQPNLGYNPCEIRGEISGIEAVVSPIFFSFPR